MDHLSYVAVGPARAYWRAARPAREGTGQSLSSVLSRASRRYEGRPDTGPRGVCRQRQKSANYLAGRAPGEPGARWAELVPAYQDLAASLG